MFPTKLETARLLLRKPTRSDADAIFREYAQDADVTRYLLWKPHPSVEVTRRFVDHCIEAWRGTGGFPYAIVHKADGELLGMAEMRVAEHRASVGYVLAKRHWGHGYMPEALSGLVALALAQPSIYRIDATCDVDNRASARALEKAGFNLEGRLRRYMIHPNMSGEPRDSFLYAITK